ncbi:MAG TPA: hypothetical protein VKZ59_14400, partial [Acidobacteriota bacterium]|nr:hypothetical protein [Acidobacteriota bacterium]
MTERRIVLTNDVIYGYALNASWAVGGAERAQWLLARSLAAKDWDVKIGVRQRLEAGQSDVIDGVEFIGIGRGQ